MPLHWCSCKKNAPAAAHQRVTCVSGSLYVTVAEGISGSYIMLGGAGMSVEITPGQRISWGRSRSDAQVPLTVDLVADHILWRNICSAVQDRDIFPRLASTPFWLKALFAILDLVSSWKEWLLSLMLWIQLRAIVHSHNFRMYHGYLPVTWPWIAQPFGGRPPVWVKRLELQSQYFIARAVMTAAYWIGTLFLGMKGEYVEYTPSTGYRDEKR